MPFYSLPFCSFHLPKYQLLSYQYVSSNIFLWTLYFKFLISTSDLARDLSIWMPVTCFQQDCLINLLLLPINTVLIFSKVCVAMQMSLPLCIQQMHQKIFIFGKHHFTMPYIALTQYSNHGKKKSATQSLK